MKIKEKLMMDMKGLMENGPINIVIFGDSVSHGAVNGYIDYENVYWNRLKRKMNALRDYVPVNMINASIGGTTAKQSLPRLQGQVLVHKPDLVIVCFGLNDVNGTLEDYTGSLAEIFRACAEAGAETVFMTPNMLNTRVADDTPKEYYSYAIKTAEMQNSGRMDEFVTAARETARRMGVAVCDCYALWKEISRERDVTDLLANRINHPTSEMHSLFADCLYDLLIGDTDSTTKRETTMFE